MEQPIISPWFIYLLSLVNDIIFLTSFISILSLLSLILALIFYFDERQKLDPDYEGRDSAWYKKVLRDLNTFKKWVNISLVITIICGTCAVFIPNRTTIIAMCIAKNVTYSSIDKAEDRIETILDKTLEKAVKFNKALEEGTKEGKRKK